jgi:nucleotide-binding universal stress UspA family protein
VSATPPKVLCSVDFSDASRGALRYAGLIAKQAGTPLAVLTVIDPLLEEAADLQIGRGHLRDDTQRELQRFVTRAFAQNGPPPDVHIEVRTGRPATEILRLSRERGSDLIVMSSHGLTGVRKMFFGSTAERVLRETTIPVLVTPAGDQGPLRPEDVQGSVRRVLLPVDLTGPSTQQLRVAQRIASDLSVPLLLLHVVEPLRAILPPRVHLPNVDAERRDRAERTLADLLATLPAATRTEALVVFGEPSEEIAKVAADRSAGLIVMGLHSSELLGPRMGSVTYRVLCLAPKLVLALPPVLDESSGQAREPVSTEAS